MNFTAVPYDLLVIGATGFVGKILCRELLIYCRDESLRWAIAGRSQQKLNDLKQSLGSEAVHVPTLVVDITDEVALTELCAQTKVIISTVGPYALYGETLVKICATSGTDYCDLTGEVQWVQQMIQKYQAIAQQSGARIIHCCGFDSVPSDLGVYYLQQQMQRQFGATARRVKMRVKAAKGGFSGGTAASGVNLIQEAIADPTVKAALQNPHILCPTTPVNQQHPPNMLPVQIDHTFGTWVTPFIMAGINVPIVLRSNALQNWIYGEDFQYDEAMVTGTSLTGWLTAQGLKIALDIFALLAAIAPNLLKKILPAAGEGPSPAEQAQGFYDLRFWGETAAGQTCLVKVTGDRDPGYGSTAKILAQTSICLTKDYPKSTKSGGFWTPAALFGETLIHRLIKNAGLTFEVLTPSAIAHNPIRSSDVKHELS